MARRGLYEGAAKVSKESPKLRVGTSADPLNAGSIERIKHIRSMSLSIPDHQTLERARPLCARPRCAYRATDQERGCEASLVQ